MEPVTNPESEEEGPAFTSPFENGGIFARSIIPGPGYVEPDESSKLPKLVGKLAVFGEWAEINSSQEGHFLERLVPGAFSRTLHNNPRVPVLFQHGQHPRIGGLPLGKILNIQESEQGIDYEVELFDTEDVRSILPALRAGEFGSSFTFRPVRDKHVVTSRPQRSSYNPDRLPEVVHHEVKMLEFGPGIMPYYAGATAGVRSATDELVLGRFAPERLRQLLTTVPNPSIVSTETALSIARPEDEPHSDVETREKSLVPVRKRFQTTQGWLAWCESALK